MPHELQTLLFKLSIYGVTGFFAISGYSLMMQYQHTLTEKRDIPYYMLRRFLRIAPLYWGVCLVFLAGRILFCDASCDTLSNDVIRLFLNISFTFGFFNPGLTSFVVGGWSIGIEWVFYLIFPLILLYLTPKWRIYLFIAALFYNLFHMNMLLNHEASFGDNFWLYAQAPAMFVYFLAGMLMASYRQNTPHDELYSPCYRTYIGNSAILSDSHP
jgi:peptidoglycan/LPS O-acetylase OafA/YrhL